MPKGKYVEWLREDNLLRLEEWARDGLSDSEIAAKIGISESTYYAWISKYSEISEAIKKGKAPVDMKVENALLKKALGYEWEEVTTEISDGKKHIKKVTRHVPPDTAAIIFWLKNRKKTKWKEKPFDESDSDAMKKAAELLGGVDSAID